MDIKVLRYFVSVAKRGSISAASRELFITQPTLTRQIQDLEGEVGHKLFERHPRNLELTDKGELLFKKALEIIALTDTTVSLLQDDKNLCGEIRIGAAESSSFQILANALKLVHAKAPYLKFHIQSGDDAYVIKGVHAGDFDLGLTVGMADHKGFATILLPQKCSWGLITKIDGPFAKKQEIQAQDLRECDLIVSEQMLKHQDLSGWLNMHETKLHFVATYNLLNNAIQLAKAGLGHVISLDGIINLDQESELRFIPFVPKIEANSTLFWNEGIKMKEPLRLLLNLLEQKALK